MPSEAITKRHITRWLTASINKHFASLLGNDIYIFFEGEQRDTRDKTRYLEVRNDGPFIRELSAGYFNFYMEINVLVTSAVNDQNLYGIQTDTGLVLEAMKTSIPVYRYGTGTDDDQSLVGCFTLISDRRNSLDAFQLGRKLIETPLMTAIVEGHYDMNIILERP